MLCYATLCYATLSFLNNKEILPEENDWLNRSPKSKCLNKENMEPKIFLNHKWNYFRFCVTLVGTKQFISCLLQILFLLTCFIIPIIMVMMIQLFLGKIFPQDQPSSCHYIKKHHYIKIRYKMNL